MFPAVTASPVRRDKGKFVAGGPSANPGGRPKVIGQVREAAQRLSPEAIATLHELMTSSKDDRVRLGAAVEILNRAVGKPEQAIRAAPSIGLIDALKKLNENYRNGVDAKLINSTAKEIKE